MATILTSIPSRPPSQELQGSTASFVCRFSALSPSRPIHCSCRNVYRSGDGDGLNIHPFTATLAGISGFRCVVRWSFLHSHAYSYLISTAAVETCTDPDMATILTSNPPLPPSRIAGFYCVVRWSSLHFRCNCCIIFATTLLTAFHVRSSRHISNTT